MDSVYVETTDVGNKQSDVPCGGIDRAFVLRVREITCGTVRECRSPICIVLKQRIDSINLFGQSLFGLFLREATEANIDRYAAVLLIDK